MRTLYRVLLVLAALSWAAVATAGDTSMRGPIVVTPKPGPATLSPPVLVLSFTDHSNLHNMGIASDGLHYYTCDGGNASVGRITTYDLAGNLQGNVACLLDMRALMWNAADHHLYAKTFEGDLYQVDPSTGAFTLVHGGMFMWTQSSPAITPDGSLIVEHESGSVRFYDPITGNLLNTLSGLSCGSYPTNEALATDGVHLYTWNGSQVFVYDFAGNLVESYVLPHGDYGFSLKLVNGLLFAGTDGYGGPGTWYGYNVGAITPTRESTWGAIKSLYR